MHKCDGGLEQDSVRKIVFEQGIWRAIFCGISIDACCTDWDKEYTILIQRKDKKRVTDSQFLKFKPVIERCDNLFLASYNDHLAHTNNMFIQVLLNKSN